MQASHERDFVLRRWSSLADLDWLLLGPLTILIIFSFLLLSSASSGNFLSKQFLYLFPALIIGTGVLFIKIDFLQKYNLWFYTFSILFLILVLYVGQTAQGAQRWINLGYFNVQPAEISKLALVLTLAAYFTKKPVKNYLDIFLSALIVLPVFLLVFKQPDLGTSLVFIAIYLGMAFWAGATLTNLLVVISPVLSLIFNACGNTLLNFGLKEFNNRYEEMIVTNYFAFFLFFLLVWLVFSYKAWKSPLTVFLVSTVVLFNFLTGFIRPVLWGLLQPYQQKRLTIFLNPERDPQGAGYHIVQSLLAVGNGGLFGYGYQHGRLTKGEYVPASHTDFIFSTCGEEYGFIGTAFIVIMFLIILLRILYIVKNSNNNFASLVSVGIFSLFSFHVFINIGMTIGIMPITGVPLPFLSYGGSALVVDIFAVFLLLSIAWRTLPKKMF